MEDLPVEAMPSSLTGTLRACSMHPEEVLGQGAQKREQAR